MNRNDIINIPNYNTTQRPRKSIHYTEDFSVDPSDSKTKQYKHKIMQ